MRCSAVAGAVQPNVRSGAERREEERRDCCAASPFSFCNFWESGERCAKLFLYCFVLYYAGDVQMGV